MKREDTKRMLLTMPASMHEALERQSIERDTPMSAIIRFAIEQLLTAWGEEVRDDVLWGGARYTPKRKEDTAPPDGAARAKEIA